MPTASLIVAAAGRGERFAQSWESDGREAPPTKVFAPLAGETVLARTLACFEGVEAVTEAVVAIAEADAERGREAVGEALGEGRPLKFVAGGEERLDSVGRAFRETDPGTELVIVHDAVRPLVRAAVIEEAMRVAVEHGAAVVGRPVDHTVKRIRDGRIVAETVARENLWLAQTPQVFRREVIAQAYARRDDVVGRITDDAQLVEALGREVVMVPGDAANFKITTPEDLRMCEALLAAGWPFE